MDPRFDARTSASDGDGGLDDGGPNDDSGTNDGAAATCPYMNCTGSLDACCIGSNTTCVTAGTCGGVVLECEPGATGGCPQFMECCAPGVCSAAACDL